jgi:hypothetical protein
MIVSTETLATLLKIANWGDLDPDELQRALSNVPDSEGD